MASSILIQASINALLNSWLFHIDRILLHGDFSIFLLPFAGSILRPVSLFLLAISVISSDMAKKTLPWMKHTQDNWIFSVTKVLVKGSNFLHGHIFPKPQCVCQVRLIWKIRGSSSVIRIVGPPHHYFCNAEYVLDNLDNFDSDYDKIEYLIPIIIQKLHAAIVEIDFEFSNIQ